MKSRFVACVALLAVFSGMAACADLRPTPAPRLRTGAADQIGPRLTNYGTAVLPQGAAISVWGDDFTGATQALNKRGKASTLAVALAHATGLKVADHMSPGQTLDEGLAQLRDGDAGSLVVLCYGYGDLAKDGGDDDGLKFGQAVARFKASLDAMVKLAHSRGVPVLVVTEPPPPAVTLSKKPTAAEKGRAAFVAKVAGLNGVASAAAVAEGAGVIDSASLLAVNTLAPEEKRPGSPLVSAHIANAIAADIELAR